MRPVDPSQSTSNGVDNTSKSNYFKGLVAGATLVAISIGIIGFNFYQVQPKQTSALPTAANIKLNDIEKKTLDLRDSLSKEISESIDSRMTVIGVIFTLANLTITASTALLTWKIKNFIIDKVAEKITQSPLSEIQQFHSQFSELLSNSRDELENSRSQINQRLVDVQSLVSDLKDRWPQVNSLIRYLPQLEAWKTSIEASNERIRANQELRRQYLTIPNSHLSRFGLGNNGVSIEERQDLIRQLERLEDIYDLRPDLETLEDRLHLGNAWTALHKYKEAERNYGLALRESSCQSAEAYHGQGVVLFNLEKYEEAQESYERAIGLKEHFPEAWFDLANACGRLGDIKGDRSYYRNAIANYEKAIQLRPSYAAAYFGKGLAHFKLAEYELAVDSYEKAVIYDGTLNYYWRDYGDALSGLLRYGEAVGKYEQALRLSREGESLIDRARTLHSYGDALRKSGQLDKAIDSYTEAIKLNPGNYESYFKRGKAYCKQGRFEAAMKDFQEALQKRRASGRSEIPNVLSYLGFTQQKLSESCNDLSLKQKAEHSFSWALDLLDQENLSCSTAFDKARCYLFQNDLGAAIESLCTAKECDPICLHWIDQDADFEAIRAEERFKQWRAVISQNIGCHDCPESMNCRRKVIASSQ